jgi:aspartate beta-hydroxylase
MATIIQSAVCKTNRYFRPSPSLFYFPGLTSKPVWSGEKDFPHIQKTLVDSLDMIKEEYLSLVSHKTTVSDYHTQEEHNKLHQGKWEWFSYVMKGNKQLSSPFVQHCPKTTKLLESLESPRLMINTPFSYSFFSKLHPHSTIACHTSPCNLRIRCHLPLIVPKQSDLCGIRVADKALQWKVGEPIFFDDSYEHEGKV